MQEPLCKAVQLDCVRKIKADSINSKCLPECSGLILTSFSKSDSKNGIQYLIPSIDAVYKNYTKWAKFPSEMKGIKTMIYRTTVYRDYLNNILYVIFCRI